MKYYNIANPPQESITQLIDLKGDDPKDIGRMLSYIYTQQYDDDETDHFGETVQSGNSAGASSTDSENPCLEMATVPSSAGIESLSLAQRAEHRSAPPSLPKIESLTRALNHISTYAIADKYDVRGLRTYARNKCNAQSWYKWSLTPLRIITSSVYSSTPPKDRGLRPLIADACAVHAKDLIYDPEWCELLRNENDLAADILEKTVKKNEAFKIDAQAETQALLEDNRRTIEQLRKKEHEAKLRDKFLHDRISTLVSENEALAKKRRR